MTPTNPQDKENSFKRAGERKGTQRTELPEKRDRTLDTVAGLLVVYMVFTHITQFTATDCSPLAMALKPWLCFFMAWFFFKAGMFSRATERGMLIRKSGHRLLLPWLVYGLIGHTLYLAVRVADDNWTAWECLKHTSADLIYGLTWGGNAPLWFLASLFIVRVAANEIYLRRWRVPACAGVCLIAALALCVFRPGRFGWTGNIPLGLAFYLSGNYWHNRATPPVGIAFCQQRYTFPLPHFAIARWA